MNGDYTPRLRHQIAIGDSVLAVVEEGRGPAVVLGQSYLWDWRMWQPQMEALASRCRVIVPELWGHGDSGPLPSGTASLANVATQMLEMLDQLEIDRCVIVGCSVGGMWGAHLAARAPERVAGLVLMNTSLGKEPEPKRLSYAAMLDQVEAEGRIGDGLMAAITPLFFAKGIEQRAPYLPQCLRERLRRFSPGRLRQSVVPLGRLIFDRPDALGVLAGIKAPTLIIAGANDQGRPPEESRIMAELFPAELVVIQGAGHSAGLERPEEVNAALLAFLDEIGWGATPPLQNPQRAAVSLHSARRSA